MATPKSHLQKGSFLGTNMNKKNLQSLWPLIKAIIGDFEVYVKQCWVLTYESRDNFMII